MLYPLCFPTQDLHIWQLKENIQLSLPKKNPWNLLTVGNTYKKHLSDRCLQEKRVPSPGLMILNISEYLGLQCPVGFCCLLWSTLQGLKAAVQCPFPFLGFRLLVSDVCIWLEIKTTVCIAFGPSVKTQPGSQQLGTAALNESCVSSNKAHFHAKCHGDSETLFFSKHETNGTTIFPVSWALLVWLFF